MVRKDDIPLDSLHDALADVESKRPTLRLVAGIAYKHGVTQTELAEWFAVERKTVYNWLTRLENLDDGASIRDAPRPGRPRKLSGDELDRIEEAVHSPPAESGIDEQDWTPEALGTFIANRFGVDYSRSSCRRLLREAGLRPRPTGGRSADGPARPRYTWRPVSEEDE